MTDNLDKALQALSELEDYEFLEYLTDMTILDPEGFLDLVSANHMLMLEELRDEKHNGYSMYPELQK
jgi:hypothetical protein